MIDSYINHFASLITVRATWKHITKDKKRQCPHNIVVIVLAAVTTINNEDRQSDNLPELFSGLMASVIASFAQGH